MQQWAFHPSSERKHVFSQLNFEGVFQYFSNAQEHFPRVQNHASNMSDNEEDDLYGDLILAGKDAEIERLNKELFEKERENNALKEEIEQLRLQLATIAEEKLVVENNLMAIYNTGMREIKRKEKEIAELRKSNC